ncbi:pbs lyase heat domain protein repeat-containing protein [Nannochloropsis oceanica]
MCRMQGSGTAPNPSPFGFWPTIQYQQQNQHQHQQQHREHSTIRQAAARRRYKYETKLGEGHHGGIMYKARCDRGKLWAIEVISDPAKATAATALAKQYHLTQDEPWMQSTPAGSAAQQAAGKTIDLCVPEEMYIDHKGAWCIVSKLPKESMRQRIMTDASYGLESVVNWARQLASSLAGAPKQERDVVSLDNVFLDDADCVLVGNYTPSDCFTPSTVSSEEEDEEEEENVEMRQLQEQEQQRQPGYGHHRQQPKAQKPKQQRQSKKGKGAMVCIKTEEPDDHQKPQAQSGQQQLPRVKSWSAVNNSSKSSNTFRAGTKEKATATAMAAAEALSREQELKRWGVLMYQVATKTILHGDVDTARRQILRSAQAEMEGEGSWTNKEALLALLHRQLGISDAGNNPSSGNSGGSSSSGSAATITLVGGKVVPAGASLESLANAIADAVLGEEEKKETSFATAAPSSAAPAAPMTKIQSRPHEFRTEVPEPISTMFRSSPSSVSAVALTALVPSSSAHHLKRQQPQQQQHQQQQPPNAAATRSILAALQQTRDTKMRQRAFVALGKLGPKAAVPELVLALMPILEKDVDPVSRRLAAWTLGSMGNGSPEKVAQAAMPLIRALGDKEAAVRAAAAWALGHLGKVCEERGAVATLLHRSVKDADPQVREMALKSITRLRRVTGKRRRNGREEECSDEGKDGAAKDTELTSGGRPKAYAKRRPFCLASATLSMEMASIGEGRGGMRGLMRPSPTVVDVHQFSFGPRNCSINSSLGTRPEAGECGSRSNSVGVKIEPSMMPQAQYL